MAKSDDQITHLLRAWSQGDTDALDRLTEQVYDVLRAIAANRLRAEPDGHTLQTTALVNEAWIRLARQTRVSFKDRSHFFAIAARMMRRVLVDHARHHGHAKRGGNAVRVDLEGAVVRTDLEHPRETLALHDALCDLSTFDEGMARMVELKFFGGMTHEEIAVALETSLATVNRRWRAARAWLYQRLRGTATAGGQGARDGEGGDGETRDR